jgi:hypothetical protein
MSAIGTLGRVFSQELKRPRQPDEEEEPAAKRIYKEKCVCMYLLYNGDGTTKFCKKMAVIEYQGTKLCVEHLITTLLNNKESSAKALIQIPLTQ